VGKLTGWVDINKIKRADLAVSQSLSRRHLQCVDLRQILHGPLPRDGHLPLPKSDVPIQAL